MKNNIDYKAFVDLHRTLRTFNVGDYVMIRLRPERFPPGTVKKLHVRSAGPIQILKIINSNAYVVDLPPDFGISYTFNVKDLVSYKGSFDTPFDPFMDKPTHDFLSKSPTTFTSSKIISCSRKRRFYFEWLDCLN